MCLLSVTLTSVVFLEKVRMIHSRDKNSQLGAQRSLLLRSLYVVSLMCKHFDFDEVAETSPLPQMVRSGIH